MTEQRSLPIDTQTFEQVRSAGNVYIDKTPYIEKLLRLGRLFFLSRPHRFGKSLFLSTLQAYFEGKKHLFEGLYIAAHEEELAHRLRREPWEETPVLYFDLNAEYFSQGAEVLENCLDMSLAAMEKRYGSEGIAKTLPGRFKAVIERAYEQTQKQVVILIDEYDKPLLLTLQDPELNEANRSLLRAFYEVLKHCDRYIRFAFLTGITKFSKTNLFSGANNLMDITLLDNYAAICGFTEQELTDNLMPEIERLAKAQKSTVAKTRATLKKKYDGYRFSPSAASIYNPFSLLSVLAFSMYKYYWFETATPAFLISYLKQINYYVPNIRDGVEVSEGELQDFRVGALNPLPVLFQSGYLTLKDYSFEENIYRLRFPNEEVKYGFLRTLLMGYYPIPVLDAGVDIIQFRKEILRGDVDAFMKRLEAIIAGIPYGTISPDPLPYHERDGQVAVYLVFALLGQFLQTEVHNHIGRADAVLHTPEIIYVFEFKLDGTGTPEEALQQIEDKGYALPYQTAPQRVVKVGVAFNEGRKNIGSWVLS